MRQTLFAIVLVLLLIISCPPVFAYYTYMPASLVLGQPDFLSGTANNGGISASTFNQENGVAVANGRLFVADNNNNRILIWNHIPTQNNTPADLVLGQPDFVSSAVNNGGISASTLSAPTSISSDGTKLAVADSTNRRVLIWNAFPTINHQPADVVVGQPDFTTVGGAQITASKFSAVSNVLFANGKLFIAESSNRRVLIYNSVPQTNGAAADVVIGQADMTTGSYGGLDAVHFGSSSGPRGMAVYNNKLVVADNSNSRVLIWNSIPTTNGVPADVVIGQPDMTSNTPDNGGISCATIEGLAGGIGVTGNGRLLITDDARLLIFNQIPTSNFQSADMVIGKPDCVTRTSGTTANLTSSRIRGVSEYGQKLFVEDSSNNRLLIFDNVLSTPNMNINTPLTNLNDGTGRLRVSGNIQLGERNTYSMQTVKAEVNGQGLSNVTYLDGGRDDGTTSTRYEFHHDFNPGNILNSDSSNFTLLLQASSYNVDTSSLFYFQPFKLNSVNNNIFSFSVNKYQIQKIKDNIDRFEIYAGNTLYISNIPTSLIDTNTGQVVVTRFTPGITFPNLIIPGTYNVKVRAVSKNSNWGFDSNILSSISLIGSTSSSIPVTSNLVLQINNITGSNTGILSTFNSNKIKPSYTITELNPIITGLSWAQSNITMIVINKDNISQSKTFITKVKSDSLFALNPTFYQNSIIQISTTKDGRYNFLPPFTLNQTFPQTEAVIPTVQGTEAIHQEAKPTSTSEPVPIQSPSPKPKSCFLWWCW